MSVVIFSIEDSEAVKEEDEEMKAKRLQAQAERKEKLAAAVTGRPNLNPVRSGSSKRPNPSEAEDRAEGEVSIGSIIGPLKKAKQDYAERMESNKNGREGREKFGSRKGSSVQFHAHIKKQNMMKH
ncbi:hypothetical protein BGZ82_009484 [Podila clonocystis]|nr:hypothetical protein BGZ82_009484 [Podila clonocystis]